MHYFDTARIITTLRLSIAIHHLEQSSFRCAWIKIKNTKIYFDYSEHLKESHPRVFQVLKILG